MRNLLLSILLLTTLSLGASVLGQVPQDTASNRMLQSQLQENVDNLRYIDEYSDARPLSTTAKREINELTLAMKTIRSVNSLVINTDEVLLALCNEFDAISSRINIKLQQQKNDSVVGLLNEKLMLYDSLFETGKCLEKAKAGDSVILLKQKENERWVEIIGIKAGLNDNNTEMQSLLDTLECRHGQIQSLSEKNKPTIGNIIAKLIPILLSLVAIIAVVKIQVEKAKAKKRSEEEQKKAAERMQELMKNQNKQDGN